VKLTEVEHLLATITSLDRQPFPDGAAGEWYRILGELEYRDALQAVVEHYGSGSGRLVSRIMPADVRSRALAIAEARARAARRALPAAPVRATPAVRDAALAAMRAIAQRGQERQAEREREWRNRQASVLAL
jgi:hypothetical protein